MSAPAAAIRGGVLTAQPEGRPALPLVLTGVAVLAALGTLVVGAGLPGPASGNDLIWFVAWLLWCPAGVFIARAAGSRRLGGLVAALGAGVVLGAFCGALAHRLLLGHLDRPPLVGLAASVAQRLLADLPAAAPLLLLVFPDGRLPGPRWRPVLGAGLLVVAVTVLTDLFRVGPLDDDLALPNPLAVRTGPVLPAVHDLAAASVLVLVAVGIVSLVVRRRSGTERERAGVVLFAVAACWLLVILVVAAIAGLLQIAGGPVLRSVGQALVLLLLPAAACVAVVRRAYSGAEAALNRSLTYLALTTVIVGGYAVSVTVLGRVVEHRAAFGVSLIMTGVIAVALGPLKLALERAVERVMLGQRSTPYAALTELARRIGDTPAPQDALDVCTRTVAEALRSPYVCLAVRAGVGETVVSHYGGPRTTDLSVALVAGGTRVGDLRLAHRSPHERFHAADQRLLADFADRIAGTVAVVRLGADLQQSREALVRAREEERRRIRRELHDGIGPVLASAALALGRAQRQLAGTDPAHRMLGEAADEVRAAIGDVRNLVHDLRPAALDELGLVAALRQRAAALSDPDRVIAVRTAGPLPDLPAAVEVAAYRIAAEALTNVARHALATHAEVVLSAVDDQLHLSVVDDGRGFGQVAEPGIGLASMRERAVELGGSFRTDSRPGRTEVLAWLPIR